MLLPRLGDGVANLAGVVLGQRGAGNMHALGIVLADDGQHSVAQLYFGSVFGVVRGDGRDVGAWCVDQLPKPL